MFDQAHRRQHRGERQQQRDPGRHQRAEHDQQDHQRDRQRQHPGLLQVLHEDGLQLLVGAGAERLDAEVAVLLLRGLHLRDDRVDLVDGLLGVALDVQRDEDRVAVLGDHVAACVVGVVDRSAPPRASRRAWSLGHGRLEAASSTVSSSLWTRTISPAGCGKRLARASSPRWPDSPAALSEPVSCSADALPDENGDDQECEPAPDRQPCGAWRSSDLPVLRCP